MGSLCFFFKKIITRPDFFATFAPTRLTNQHFIIMMKKSLFWALALMVSITACKGGKTEKAEATEEKEAPVVGLAIDETNFPDPVIRANLLEGSAGMDSILTDKEIENLWILDVSGRGASDLTGIDKLTGLTFLNVNGFRGTMIDVSQNANLTEIYCCDSPSLTSIKLGDKPNLLRLNFSNTNVSNIDLTQCPKLEMLYMLDTPIGAVDLSGCPELKEISCETVLMPGLDLSACPNAGFVD